MRNRIRDDIDRRVMLIGAQDMFRDADRSKHVADTIEWYMPPLTDSRVRKRLTRYLIDAAQQFSLAACQGYGSSETAFESIVRCAHDPAN